MKCGARYEYEEENKEPEPFRVLVVGECGDGKSMLIKAFLKTYGGQWNENLQSGIAAKGVSKEVVPYKFTFGGRPAVIFDTPGIGDGTVKLPQLVAAIELALKSGPNKCHAIMICSKMSNNRVNLGAQIVASLIKAGMVEKNRDQGVHKNIVFVGTQLDLYVASCKTEAKKRKKIALWDSQIPQNMNERCGFTGKDTIRVAHTSIIIEDDAPMDDPDMEIDISEPSRELMAIMKAGKSVSYHKPPPMKLLRMFAKETGLEAEEEKLKEMAAQLEAARKQLEKFQNQRWYSNFKDLATSLLGAAAGFAAGGPIGALGGAFSGLSASKVDSKVRHG